MIIFDTYVCVYIYIYIYIYIHTHTHTHTRTPGEPPAPRELPGARGLRGPGGRPAGQAGRGAIVAIYS